jgi:alkylhydroperoxidase family enzyme
MKDLGIKTDLSPAGVHTEREQLALEYADRITRDSNRIPDEVFKRLRAVFADPEIVELTFHIGFITMLNRFNNALQVGYRGEFKDVKIH